MVEISRYNINIRNVMEDLYIGPQGQVLQDLERFNDRFVRGDDLKLGITPKFRWKPGSYDKVKEILNNEWLRWSMRPSGMHSIFNRERVYMKTRLKDELLAIETSLMQLRSQGLVFLTDPDEINGKFNFLKEKLQEQFEILTVKFPGSSMRINNNPECFSNHTIEIYINMKDVSINVTVGGSDSNREIGIIPFGDVELRVKINIAAWFNNIYNYLSNDSLKKYKPTFCLHNSNKFGILGRITPIIRGTHHPFISSYRQSYPTEEQDSGFMNTCTGEMQKDINNTFLKFDFNSFSYWIDSWMTTYKCGVTGPLNNISSASIGKHPIYDIKGRETTEEYYEVVGFPRTTVCFDRQQQFTQNIDEVIEQCDIIGCLLKDTCNGYQINTEYSAKEIVWENWKEENYNLEVLMPNQQDDAKQAKNFKNWAQDTFYYVNTTYSSKFKIDYEFLFANKRTDLALDMIIFLLNDGIICYYEDMDEAVSDTVEEFLVSFDNDHEKNKELLNNFYPLIPIEDGGELTDRDGETSALEDEMITWAIAQRNRNR